MCKLDIVLHLLLEIQLLGSSSLETVLRKTRPFAPPFRASSKTAPLGFNWELDIEFAKFAGIRTQRTTPPISIAEEKTLNLQSRKTPVTSSIVRPKRVSGLSEPYLRSTLVTYYLCISTVFSIRSSLPQHSFCISKSREFIWQVHIADSFKNMPNEAFIHAQHLLKCYKTRLDIKLAKLWLPICTKIFITEASS